MASNQRRLSPSPDRSLLVRVLVCLTLTALVLTGCSPAARALRPPDPVSVSGDGTVTNAGFTVTTADPGQTVTLAPPTLDQAAYDSLLSWAESGAAVGSPVEVTLDGEVPDGGVTLTRTFPVAIPEDVAVTFVYHDDTIGEWRAVVSDISPDRLSVSATVDHLSIWTTITGGAQQAMDVFTAGLSAAGTIITGAADSAYQGVQQFNNTVERTFVAAAEGSYYTVGKVFDVRVDAPTCDGDIPGWADSTTFIATDRNNPVLWCAGHDAQHPELLVVKARINRGYGSFAETAATPAWTYNSAYDQDTFDAALAAITELDQVIAQSVTEITGGGRLVGAGMEISFGFSEEAVRALEIGQPLVTLAIPNLSGFLATSIAQAITKSGTMLEGTLAALIGVASCSKDMAGVNDIETASRAAITCISEFDDVIAQKVALGLLQSGMSPQAAGQTAGSTLAKFTVWLALIGPVFNIMNYTADSMLPDSARTLTVFVARQKPGIFALTSGVVCDVNLSEYGGHRLKCWIPKPNYDGVSVPGDPVTCRNGTMLYAGVIDSEFNFSCTSERPPTGRLLQSGESATFNDYVCTATADVMQCVFPYGDGEMGTVLGRDRFEQYFDDDGDSRITILRLGDA